LATKREIETTILSALSSITQGKSLSVATLSNKSGLHRDTIADYFSFLCSFQDLGVEIYQEEGGKWIAIKPKGMKKTKR